MKGWACVYTSTITMSHLTRPVRFVVLLLAAMQFVVPAVVSVADGAVARSGRESAAHIEGAGANQCAPIHPADCMLCRFLSTTGSPHRASVAVVLDTDVPGPFRTLVAFRVIGARYGINSRAPPNLLA